MPGAPIPPNEPERLASVRRLGDLSHAGRAGEAVTGILRDHFRGRAYVNVIGENRQYPFLSDPEGPMSCPRSEAFCAYVVANAGPVIVPDAARDERFADHPRVRSGEIGFYYGTPVYTPEGHVAGALCVQGPGPRTPTEPEIDLLRRLGELVSEQLRVARRFAETERHFRSRENLLRQLIASTPASVAMFDTEMRYIAASDRWVQRWTGGNKNVAGRSHYDDLMRVPAAWIDEHRRCLAGETRSATEDHVVWPNGEASYINWRLVPWYAEPGVIGGVIVFSEDVTASVRARKELETSNNRLRLAVESARAGMWEWDVVAGKVHRDVMWWEVHGFEPGAVGENVEDSWQLVQADDRERMRRASEDLMAGRIERMVCESRFRDGAGRWVWFETHSIVSARDENGKVTRIVGLNLRIDERKQLELQRIRQTEDLAAAKSALEEQAEHLLTATREAGEAREAAIAASRAKSRFLANMSHEIRTPVAAMLGFADVLDDEGATPDARAEAVAAIRRNGAHLLTLIDEILDLSRVEAGKMRVEAVRCDLHAVSRDSLGLVEDFARRKGLALAFHADPSLPEHADTDPTRLRQVLTNLLNNAVKFTDRGGVSLHASAQDGRIVFEVHDTGIGTDAETAARVFLPFEQADASSTRRHGGSGLGLSISSHLAAMLGGELAVVRSEPGRGTVMRLTIDPGRASAAPAHRAERPAPAAPATPPGPPPDLTGARILLAEDGPDNQRLLTYILKRAGATVTVAADGVLALAAVPDCAHPPFDLILLDMQMPEMDGYDTARHLRERGLRTPIIALTANAMEGDRARCMAAGCDDYASKPIAADELRRLCALWLARGRSENRSAA